MNVYDILGQLSPIEPTPPSQPDDSQLVADFGMLNQSYFIVCYLEGQAIF